ncbi:MAG: hypothetical protein WB680_10275 [Candidatus Acidiferrales bacterium]
MSNGLKFRPPQPKTNTTKQKVAGRVGTQFGQQDDSVREQLQEEVKRIEKGTKQLTNQMLAVSARSGKAKSGRTSGVEGKQRKARRGQRTKSGRDQRQPPPGQGRRGTGGEDEGDRVVAMLESIRKTLGRLVIVTPRVVPQELHPSIRQSWHQAEEGFKTAIAALQDKTRGVELNAKLETAGFKGEMLDMKETSLSYHMAGVNKAILSYNNNETMLEKFVKWIKPGFKVMNSVLGSLTTIPGVEVGKEFKEHLESAYEVVETGQAE